MGKTAKISIVEDRWREVGKMRHTLFKTGLALPILVCVC
tara:strand:- start:9 stop:125 length:117 start_codon:yes stop_codon:yes gene_type:complete